MTTIQVNPPRRQHLGHDSDEPAAPIVDPVTILVAIQATQIPEMTRTHLQTWTPVVQT